MTTEHHPRAGAKPQATDGHDNGGRSQAVKLTATCGVTVAMESASNAMRTARAACLHAVLAVTLAACDAAPLPVTSCGNCHGSEQNAAPPNALGGFSTIDYRGVGAHQVHVTGALLGRPVACDECHIVPETIAAPGHIDTEWPAEITWGPVARAAGAEPVWNPDTRTCSGTWCHGRTETGGVAVTPDWTEFDGVGTQCNACHGMPPSAPHPVSGNCDRCHASVVGPLGDPSLHVDGKLDLRMDPPTCSSGCHGDGQSSAPPGDLLGNEATSIVTVGAHQVHLTGGRFSAPVPCSECHLVPSRLDKAGHIDTAPPAEITWGPRATKGGLSPAWSRIDATCANTYCHFSKTVTWTVVDGSQTECGSCHALPPAPPHHPVPACNMCHRITAGPDQTIRFPQNHNNGRVDF